MKLRVSIFDHSEAAPFLKANLEAAQRLNPTFSTRAWAEKLRAKDAGSFSRMLSGQRRIPKYLLQSIADDLHLSVAERLYFSLINMGEQALPDDSLAYIRDLLKADHELRRNSRLSPA